MAIREDESDVSRSASGIRHFRNERPRRQGQRGGPRVFLYSHDTYGLGHLRRNLAIAEHLLTRRAQFAVRLLTGSPVIGSWTLPEELDVTALPPVVKTGVETYRPRHSALPFSLVKAHREALILKTVIDDPPDVFLVDHAPAGMNAELLSTLAFIRREFPNTRVLLGLRDILDSPDTVRRIWAEQNIIALIESLYDRVLVYGSRDIMDVVDGYGLPASIANKLDYCGYVGRPAKPSASSPGTTPSILVTAGGGEDGFFLMEAYLGALNLLGQDRARTRIVTGPLMSEAQRDVLHVHAAGNPGIEIVPSTTDLPDMLSSADLVVAMGGYNTSVEIVASGKPAIIVPRAAPRAEQRMRADVLARLGLVWSTEPGPNLDRRLETLISGFLSGARPARRSHTLDLNGAARVGDLLESITTPIAATMEASA